MKMHKYTAPDMRTALRKVRAEHGSEVIILSTRRTAGVVELTVASDPGVAPSVAVIAPDPIVKTDDAPVPAPRARKKARDGVPKAAAVAAPGPATGGQGGKTSAPVAEAAADVVAPVVVTGRPEPSHEAPTSLHALDRELKALRRLLETQLATLGWNDLTRRSPVAAELFRQLAELGLERDLAASIIDTVPPDADLGLAREIALDGLRSRLKVTGDRWIEAGGTFVLIGPSGAGKTGALASIAARWVMRHGPSGAALVSAGDSRFGSFEQLARLGRLLGLPTFQVDDARELPSVLGRLRGQRLVLVDTASTAPRGEAADAQSEALSSVRDIATIVLTLPATLQAAALHQSASRYRALGATACIATRLDEATSLGGLLSAVIGAGLQLSYVTEGARLPDDLRPARATELVALAMTLAERHGATADEELLARRIGGRAHVSA